MLPSEIETLLWRELSIFRIVWHARCSRLPRSVWCNETSLPGRSCNMSRLAIEAAENQLLKIHRLLSCTSRELGAWWQRACNSGHVVVIVRCATSTPESDCAAAEFRVTLPSLPVPSDNVTLEPMQRILVENINDSWSIRVRVGLGYVLARSLGASLDRKYKVFSGKKAKAILKMTALVRHCLADGGRLFEVEKEHWTKEMRSLVYKRWGWNGVFQIREDNAASRRNERCVVILFDPARITEYTKAFLLNQS